MTMRMVQLNVRVSEAERRVYRRAATRAGLTLAEWVERELNDACARTAADLYEASRWRLEQLVRDGLADRLETRPGEQPRYRLTEAAMRAGGGGG